MQPPNRVYFWPKQDLGWQARDKIPVATPDNQGWRNLSAWTIIG